MPGRQFNSGNYRYGYQGKEHADEIVTADYDFGDRMYDSRLARFLSLDPDAHKYVSLSPYAYGLNRPIDGVDEDGRGWKWTHWRFWESKEVKAARTFAAQVDGEVQKMSRHHAVVTINSKSATVLYYGSLYNTIDGLNAKYDAKIESDNLHELPLELHNAIIEMASEFTFDASGDYKKYFNQNKVMLAQISLPLDIPLSGVFPGIEAVVTPDGITINQEGIFQDKKIQATDNVENNDLLKSQVMEFAKAKRGKESARQREVKHGGDGEGLKGKGAGGDKHTKPRAGRESTKNRQKPNFKKHK